ncbi:hypothetical protein FNV43_RR25814 [Rhamnella rubrinervis]|uniref:Uncharacterized protein n=1 Tax=Rhamnella rubrinervis TaxID=2594499 RepID=A0A8K0DMV3_9ROSA|nr:hypothetical protein FNV43_RR25814 [Rhamnella rubrinervis]
MNTLQIVHLVFRGSSELVDYLMAQMLEVSGNHFLPLHVVEHIYRMTDEELCLGLQSFAELIAPFSGGGSLVNLVGDLVNTLKDEKKRLEKLQATIKRQKEELEELKVKNNVATELENLELGSADSSMNLIESPSTSSLMGVLEHPFVDTYSISGYENMYIYDKHLDNLTTCEVEKVAMDLSRCIQEDRELHKSFISNLRLATNIEKMVGREKPESVAFISLLGTVQNRIRMNYVETSKLTFQSRILETEMLAISPEQPEDVRAMARRCLIEKLEMNKIYLEMNKNKIYSSD